MTNNEQSLTPATFNREALKKLTAQRASLIYEMAQRQIMTIIRECTADAKMGRTKSIADISVSKEFATDVFAAVETWLESTNVTFKFVESHPDDDELAINMPDKDEPRWVLVYWQD